MSYNLDLYYFPSCPFCVRVLDVIDDLNIKVNLKNIMQDGQSASKLLKDTGKQTVPCLYINDKPMFESSDIMNWLKQNQKELEKKS